MISITRLPQAKKNLELDLKRVYDSVYERYVREFPHSLEEKEPLFNLTEDELLDKWIIESNDEDLTDKDFLEIKEKARASEIWKAYYRFFCLGKRIGRYLRPFPRVGAAMLTFSYDLIVHSFLFSNWRWKDEEIDLSSFDLSLSSDEIYQIFQNVNPDVASAFISKLEDCSIADKELLQEALEGGQKEVFINKLKALSNSDFNSLVLISTFFHLENALVSNDWETLRTLLYIDFEESYPLDVVSILPREKVIKMMDDDYWDQLFDFGDNLTEEESVKRINAACDKIDSNIDLIRHLLYGGLKYRVPKDLDTYKLFPFERKYVEDILNDPAVKSILDELPENPDEVFEAPEDQEQHKFQQSKTQPLDPKIGEEGKPDDMEYVPHWPSDEELLGYPNNYNDSEFFTGTIFGAAGFVKGSGIKKLFKFLSSEHVLEDDLEAQLIFLARYSGKLIPGLVLKPLKWTMLEDREGALGYLIMTTVKNSSKRFSKCCNFFYFDFNGRPEMPDREAVGQAAHRWASHQNPASLFEKNLNMFLHDYGVEE